MRFVAFEKGCEPQQLSIQHMTPKEPEAHQVGIDVKAFGVNRADTLQRQGKYPPPPGESEVLGLEVAGVVDNVGSAVTGWKVGDRVFGLVAGGGYAEHVCVDSRHIMRIPDSVSFADAAGIAEIFITAYQSLFAIGDVKSGQSVLLHAGASGVSLAAIQLARTRQCRIAVTASSSEKLALCSSLGATELIDYRRHDFADALKEASFGADFILDYVAGDYLNRNLKVLNQDGKIVCLAMLSGRFADNLDMALLLGKRATIQGSTLRNRTDDYKARLFTAFSAEFLPLFDSGELKPVTDTVMPAEEVGVAHLRLENNQSKGKLICTW
ncbi:NAD(P)H-quinone oxidoreductase [Aestuariibacter salexigens]|uniref:NAD(P)H-quinone oxidoreductase n=1 Tax=Aestuariibacter salexigens TaxID=226010 RepID=UPI0003F9A9C0|nr:NAD(P)H-quinone oxidoreductase [Aestuariibacter salexigens]